MNNFRFTTQTLNKFEKEFPYVGTLQNGLWVHENPYKGTKFFVQVGNGQVMFIDGWEPSGYTVTQIIEKLKK
jgi:hypothetical protein